MEAGGSGEGVFACRDRLAVLAGVAARQAAPPVVAASSIGSWQWCPLKAWHNTSLFNAGWLRLEELSTSILDGLAVLWAAELAKKSLYRIIHGRILHGDPVEPGEAVDAARLAKLLASRLGEALRRLVEEGVLTALGLIEPRTFEEQLRRYMEAEDLVEYSRREEWPMIARRAARGFYVIGVPDRVEWSSSGGGLRVVELKTTSKPWLARRRARSYWAALSQLSAYAWILAEKWPLEEAVLVVEDSTGRPVLVERHDPEELAEFFEEKLLSVAERLASTQPPKPRGRPPCRSCEYGGNYPLAVEE